MSVIRIALWSGPRNVSTALMYSFAQRSDTAVLDEPLFGHFLKTTGAARPSREEALAVMETDAATVLNRLNGPGDKPVQFHKHMANHLVGLDLSVVADFTNVILTRDPAHVVTSYLKNVEQPTLLDLAYEQQTQLLRYLLEQGQQPIVLDSKHVLLDPKGVLQRLCQRVGIAFDYAMLSWPAGPRPEDGVWAKYWYHNLHKSTGFAPYREKDDPVPEAQQALVDECRKHYNELIQYTL